MSLPTVSVVIPCFNAERYIGSTLRSVFAQQGATLEVIVVDDGSTDASADLVAREYPLARLLKVENGGVARARNIGIAAATGQWIAFVDADDIWLPGKLQHQLSLMQSTPDCRMSYAAWHVWVSEASEPSFDELAALAARSDDERQWAGPSGWIYPELLLDCFVWTSTVLAERQLFQEIGAFDPDLRVGEDYDLWLRASRVTRIERIARPYALYRQHPHNITRRVPAANYKGEVVQRALDRWGFEGPDGRTMSRSRVLSMLAKTWSDFAAAQLAAGARSAARASARRALGLEPGHLPAWKLMIKSCLPLRSAP